MNQDIDNKNDRNEVFQLLHDISSEEMIMKWIEGRFARVYSIFDTITCTFGYNADTIRTYISNWHNYTYVEDLLAKFSFFSLLDENGREIDQNYKPSYEVTLAYQNVHNFMIQKGWARGDLVPITLAEQFKQIYSSESMKSLLTTAERLFYFDGFNSDAMDYKKQDYSYLMLTYVKSLEKYLFIKMDQLDLIQENEKSSVTFFDLVDKVNTYLQQYSNDIPNELLKCYIELLNKFRKEDRNGYFHRDILKRKDAYRVIDVSSLLMLLTSIIVDVQSYQLENGKILLKNRIGYYDEIREGYYLEAIVVNKTKNVIHELDVTLTIYDDVGRDDTYSTIIHCTNMDVNEEIKINTIVKEIPFHKDPFTNIYYKITNVEMLK